MLTPAASYGEGSSVVRTRVTASAPCGRGRSSPRASSSFRSGAFAGGKRECHRNAGTNRAKCVILVRMEFGPLHGGIRDWIIPAPARWIRRRADAPCGVCALIHKSFKCSTLHSHTRTQTHLPLRRSIKTSLTFISTVCDLLLRYGIDECSAASIQTFRLFRSILRRHASEV